MVVSSSRSGRVAFGCLLSLGIIALILYAGAKLGPPWLHYQQYRDEMRNEARYAVSLPDSVIRARLGERADSLGLPDAAKRITIRKGLHPSTVTISSDYTVVIDLFLLGKKTLHFHPSAGEPL